MILKVGDEIKIKPFKERAEVYSFAREGNRVFLGVIFKPSMRAEKFVLTEEDFLSRVHRVPSPWEELGSMGLPRETFLLFTEATRMRLAHAFDPHYAVSVTQVDAVYRNILLLPRIRFLLAEDPGLGKTIMAGLVLKELKASGVVHRTLLVVPAHLQDQ